MHSQWIEFILVDFGSTDGLKDWVLQNFATQLEVGYLRYYYTDELGSWHASKAKNTAHWLAKNEIIINLDCDNYTGYMGGQYAIRQFLKERNIVLQQFTGDYDDGTFGRIGVLKKHFERVGGYNESFEPMGYEDDDLMIRLFYYGLKYRKCEANKYATAIINTREDSIANTNSDKTWDAMRIHNVHQSQNNIGNYRVVANNGKYGIREGLFDHRNCLFNRISTEK